jgi:hypothetical protein
VVLSFYDSILLRNARDRKLLINPMLKAFQAVGMLIVM